MIKLRYGSQGQVSFSNMNEYYYALGFLANSRNAELRWENNEDQGAWGSEGRIHCLVPQERFPQCFRFTAGRGKVFARINCNEYVGNLVREHNFKYNSKTQNVSSIMETVPNMYREAFKKGYGAVLTINPEYKEKKIIKKPDRDSANESKPKVCVAANPKRPMDIQIGQRVIHKVFGVGTVVSSGAYIKISFPQCGEKTFANPGAFEMGFLRLESI